MAPRRWLILLGALVIAGVAARLMLMPRIMRSADGRIVDPGLLRLEQQSQAHVYAPTWLPRGGKTGFHGTMKGARRILQDFTDKEGGILCILAQEPRDAGRDSYNKKVFVKAADATADINGKPAYFITGTMGERRLFWVHEQTGLILSSFDLSDEDLLQIARNTR